MRFAIERGTEKEPGEVKREKIHNSTANSTADKQGDHLKEKNTSLLHLSTCQIINPRQEQKGVQRQKNVPEVLRGKKKDQ